jgi:cytochrome b6-f complex iron-sulfur subunit
VERTRRSFINWILGLGAFGSLGSVLYPVFQFMVPPRIPEPKVSSIKLGKIEEFPAGSSKVFKFGSQPAILIRTDTGDFRAFSAICTHLNCTVQFRSDWKLIWCACHNGKYDLNGLNIAGPPPRPLESFQVIIQNNDVYVARKA